jgi:hypothetical protein
VGVPIALAELLFRDRGAGPWLRRPGLAAVTALLALGALGLGLATCSAEHRFLAPWPRLAGALVVAVVVAAAALRLPRRLPDAAAGAAPDPRLVGAASLVASSLFMGVHQLCSALPNLPGIVPIAVTVAIALVMLGLALRWSGSGTRGDGHRLALAAGAVLTYAWNGFLTIPLGDHLDVAGQVAVVALALGLLAALAVRARRRPLSPRTPVTPPAATRSSA